MLIYDTCKLMLPTGKFTWLNYLLFICSSKSPFSYFFTTGENASTYFLWKIVPFSVGCYQRLKKYWFALYSMKIYGVQFSIFLSRAFASLVKFVKGTEFCSPGGSYKLFKSSTKRKVRSKLRGKLNGRSIK